MTKIKFIKLTLFSISLLYLSYLQAAVIGMKEMSMSRKFTTMPNSFPFVMVFKNNKLEYSGQLFQNSIDSQKKHLNEKDIKDWISQRSFIKYRMSLNELKILWSSSKKEIEELIQSKVKIKIIYVSVWYKELQQEKKFVKERKDYLELFSRYEKQNSNVRILNIDFDLYYK